MEKELSDKEPPTEQKRVLHKTIKKVSLDTNNLEFNTAIAQMMIFINEIFKSEKLYRKIWEPFILLLAPYAPHMAEELWEKLGHSPSIANQAWPEWIEDLTKDEELTIVVQINGKVRSKMQMPADISEEEMKESALNIDRIKELLSDKEVKKVITVPKKLVNIVAK